MSYKQVYSHRNRRDVIINVRGNKTEAMTSCLRMGL